MNTRRPYNPMVNAGAILTTSLLGDTDSVAAAFARFAGARSNSTRWCVAPNPTAATATGQSRI